MTNRSDSLIRRIAILAAVASVALLAFRVAHTQAAAPQAGYLVGEDVGFTLLKMAPARTGILIFARSTCGACQAGKPTLRKIVELGGTKREIAAQLMSVVAPQESDLQFADELGIKRDRVQDVSGVDLRLRVVPTVLVVNEYGTILYAHEGVPAETELAKIKAAITR